MHAIVVCPQTSWVGWTCTCACLIYLGGVIEFCWPGFGADCPCTGKGHGQGEGEWPWGGIGWDSKGIWGHASHLHVIGYPWHPLAGWGGKWLGSYGGNMYHGWECVGGTRMCASFRVVRCVSQAIWDHARHQHIIYTPVVEVWVAFLCVLVPGQYFLYRGDFDDACTVQCQKQADATTGSPESEVYMIICTYFEVAALPCSGQQTRWRSMVYRM